ncbi:MAG: DoxX family protein [Alcanivoracaceae bacterium]|nr:DoxX family protein [Alcanivoracaceae bacterium]
MSLKNTSKELWNALTARLNAAGAFLPQIFLRLILFWEFWEAGKMKYDTIRSGGDDLSNTVDWFASLNFPFPFDQISASANYHISMIGEVLFSLLILFGLFTRFAAISLIVITVVATAAVHWPESWNSLGELWKGYAISGKGFGNYKLPLIYVIMLLPLLFSGAGKFSLDHLLSKFSGSSDVAQQKISDLGMWGLAIMAIGVPLMFVMPYFGAALAVAGLATLIANKFLTPQ